MHYLAPAWQVLAPLRRHAADVQEGAVAFPESQTCGLRGHGLASCITVAAKEGCARVTGLRRQLSGMMGRAMVHMSPDPRRRGREGNTPMMTGKSNQSLRARTLASAVSQS